jgi:flagellar basal body-associated protein FliL
MIRRKAMWIIIGIIIGIVIIAAIVVPIIIFLPRKTDKTATATTMTMEITDVTTSQEISSTTKGR